jgi:predicted GNAT superfamily acetyltransferase
MSSFHLYNSLLSLYQGQEGQFIIAGDDDLRHTSRKKVWFKTRIKRLIAVSDVLIMADYACGEEQ